MRTNPEHMNVDNEDDQETFSIFNKLRQSRLTQGVAITLGGAALVGGILTMNHGDKNNVPKEKGDQIAAAEIAKRFDCELISLEDTGEVPMRDMISDSADRTTVRLKVNLSETSKAKPYMEKYADDGAVVWLSPVITGAVSVNEDDLSLPEFGEAMRPLLGDPSQESRKEGEYPASLDIDLYPKTDYPDGKQARIYATTSVWTDGSPVKGAFTRYDTYAAIDCGAMVFDGSAKKWKMLPHPVKSEAFLSTDTTVFDDKDNDNVWHPAQETK